MGAVDGNVVLGLDLGGTTFKTALITRNGTHEFLGRFASGRESGPENVVARILDHAAASVEEAARRGATVHAVGCRVVRRGGREGRRRRLLRRLPLA